MWFKKKNKIICFDLGGTHLRMAVVDFSSGKPFFLDFRKEKNNKKGKLREIFLSYAEKSREKYGASQIAIASAGIVDNLEKKVFQAPQVYGKNVFDWNSLEKEGFSIFLENDGRAFAWGNFVFELKQQPRTVLSLVLGTGIGGGLIIDGENYQGAHFSALEVSHTFFNLDNDLVKRPENWQEFSAGQGIEKQYWKLTKKKKTAEEIFNLANSEDKKARQALEIAGKYFSLGLANLINVLDPEVLVLGGTMVKERKGYFQEAIKESRRAIFNQKIRPKIFFSRLNEKATLLGAGDLLRKNS